MIETSMSIQCLLLVLIDAHFSEWNYHRSSVAKHHTGLISESHPKQLLSLILSIVVFLNFFFAFFNFSIRHLAFRKICLLFKQIKFCLPLTDSLSAQSVISEFLWSRAIIGLLWLLLWCKRWPELRNNFTNYFLNVRCFIIFGSLNYDQSKGVS